MNKEYNIVSINKKLKAILNLALIVLFIFLFAWNIFFFSSTSSVSPKLVGASIGGSILIAKFLYEKSRKWLSVKMSISLFEDHIVLKDLKALKISKLPFNEISKIFINSKTLNEVAIKHKDEVVQFSGDHYNNEIELDLFISDLERKVESYNKMAIHKIVVDDYFENKYMLHINIALTMFIALSFVFMKGFFVRNIYIYFPLLIYNIYKYLKYSAIKDRDGE